MSYYYQIMHWAFFSPDEFLGYRQWPPVSGMEATLHCARQSVFNFGVFLASSLTKNNNLVAVISPLTWHSF